MRGGNVKKEGAKKDDPSGTGKKAAGSTAKSAAAASLGGRGGGNSNDVYGDLFNLGPSTFGDPEAAMAGMSNDDMLYFCEEDVLSMPPTSSWDIPAVPSIPPLRSPTPTTLSGVPGNFGGAAVDARQAGEARAPGPSKPYDHPYYMSQQQQQHQMFAHNHHVNASGGPYSGPRGHSSAYADSSGYGMYGGLPGQHLHQQQQQQQYYVSGMPPPQHLSRSAGIPPAQAGAAAAAAHNRSMFHYSAGVRRYNVDQTTSGNVNVGGPNTAQGNGSGTTKAGKKKTSKKRKGVTVTGVSAPNMDAAAAPPPPPVPATSGGGYMQPAAPGYHMPDPPQAHGYNQYPYSHRGPVGLGNNNNPPHYSHPHSQSGVGQEMRRTAAAAAGVIHPPPSPIELGVLQHQHHGSREQSAMQGPRDQQQQQALLYNSVSQLGDEQLAFYLRQMLGQLQQVNSMLDVNTKKTISDSLLRLASAKQQISGTSGSAAQQYQSHQDREIDRSICQLLYNGHSRDY
jgi:hypothetical protein